MPVDYLLSIPLFLAYLLGAVLTSLIAARRKNVSSVLGFVGFILLVAVQLVLPLINPYAPRLTSRGLDVERVLVISRFAQLSLNLISAVAVLSIVGAIALASRHEWRP